MTEYYILSPRAEEVPQKLSVVPQPASETATWASRSCSQQGELAKRLALAELQRRQAGDRQRLFAFRKQENSSTTAQAAEALLQDLPSPSRRRSFWDGLREPERRKPWSPSLTIPLGPALRTAARSLSREPPRRSILRSVSAQSVLSVQSMRSTSVRSASVRSVRSERSVESTRSAQTARSLRSLRSSSQVSVLSCSRISSLTPLTIPQEPNLVTGVRARLREAKLQDEQEERQQLKRSSTPRVRPAPLTAGSRAEHSQPQKGEAEAGRRRAAELPKASGPARPSQVLNSESRRDESSRSLALSAEAARKTALDLLVEAQASERQRLCIFRPPRGGTD